MNATPQEFSGTITNYRGWLLSINISLPEKKGEISTVLRDLRKEGKWLHDPDVRH